MPFGCASGVCIYFLARNKERSSHTLIARTTRSTEIINRSITFVESAKRKMYKIVVYYSLPYVCIYSYFYRVKTPYLPCLLIKGTIYNRLTVLTFLPKRVPPRIGRATFIFIDNCDTLVMRKTARNSLFSTRFSLLDYFTSVHYVLHRIRR